MPKINRQLYQALLPYIPPSGEGEIHLIKLFGSMSQTMTVSSRSQRINIACEVFPEQHGHSSSKNSYETIFQIQNV